MTVYKSVNLCYNSPMTIDLAKMVWQIATAGTPHDAEQCKTCAYRDDPASMGYCYMWATMPTSFCHHYKADK